MMPTKKENMEERAKAVSRMLGNPSALEKIAIIFKDDKKKIEYFKSNILNIALGNCSDCTIESVIKSALGLSAIGLDVNPLKKEAYVVPYKNSTGVFEARAQISYLGYQLLIKRAGLNFKANAIYNGDVFKIVADGFNDKVIYERGDYDSDDGNVKWVKENIKGIYIRVLDAENNFYPYFVSISKINQIMGFSPSVRNKYGKSVYDDWFLEMCFAKAIKYTFSKFAMAEKVDNNIMEAIKIDNELDGAVYNESNKPVISSTQEIANKIIKNNSEDIKEAVVEDKEDYQDPMLGLIDFEESGDVDDGGI